MDPIREAEEVMSAYVGEISRCETKITMMATNGLMSRENVETPDGIKFVEKTAKVKCRITVIVHDGTVSVEADEFTYRILGGSRASYSAENLRRYLGRYMFAKKPTEHPKYTQLTFF